MCVVIDVGSRLYKQHGSILLHEEVNAIVQYIIQAFLFSDPPPPHPQGTRLCCMKITLAKFFPYIYFVCSHTYIFIISQIVHFVEEILGQQHNAYAPATTASQMAYNLANN